MKKKFEKLILFSLVFIVFKNWFIFGELSAGDAGFFYSEALKEPARFLTLWFPDGLGNYNFFLGYIATSLKLFAGLNLSWSLIERLIWYWPFLALSLFSSWYFLKTILPENKFNFFAPLIYVFNTYILMIVGGGQVSIFLAYAIAPLVFALLVKKKFTLSVLALATQVSFEPRLAAITVVAAFFYLRDFYFFLPVLLVTALLHAFWLLPALALQKSSFPASFVAGDWLGFLSFAKFPQTLSLLHPSWPENIFGKTGFFKPEFLGIPILAFSSLLFRPKKKILFFAALALVGAFLAKGVNPPFGEIYRWLFENLPGMNLFRDASKFYLLVALSYAVLIPYSVSRICQIRRKFIPNFFIFLVIFYCCWLIKPALLGQLGGTFQVREVPNSYKKLHDFLANQDEFFRTFWLPRKQRFGFASSQHPALASEKYVQPGVCQPPFCQLVEPVAATWQQQCLTNERCFPQEVSFLLNPQTQEILSAMAVKYVIIPHDSESEFFLDNYQYSPSQRQLLEDFLDTVSWLKKIKVADELAVYEVPEFQDHFFVLGEKPPQLSWQRINPTKYQVKIINAHQPFTLIFSEKYDELWQAKINGQVVSSHPYAEVLNGFAIDRVGDFTLTVEFSAQRYVYWGSIVSFLTLLVLVVKLFLPWLKSKI